MKQPKISIIIPTYNHANFLNKALRSVSSQTFEDWEAIVVNNFSEDDTEEVVKSFNDDRISIINFRNNGLIAASRNHGIKNSNSDIIAFLDSDDSWFPEKLEICYKAITNGADLVCHNENLVKDGKVLRELSYGPKEKSSYNEMLFSGNVISTSAVVVKKEHLLEAELFSEQKEHNTAEDYDLWLKLARLEINIEFINNVLGEYLLHESNNSGQVTRHLDAVISVTESHFNYVSAIEAERSHRLATIYYGAARQASSQGNTELAKTLFMKSLKMRPLYLKCLAGLALNSVKSLKNNEC